MAIKDFVHLQLLKKHIMSGTALERRSGVFIYRDAMQLENDFTAKTRSLYPRPVLYGTVSSDALNASNNFIRDANRMEDVSGSQQSSSGRNAL